MQDSFKWRSYLGALCTSFGFVSNDQSNIRHDSQFPVAIRKILRLDPVAMNASCKQDSQSFIISALLIVYLPRNAKGRRTTATGGPSKCFVSSTTISLKLVS